jgi:arginase family enzyme
VRAGGGVVHWADELTEATLSQEHERLVAEGCRRIYITIDADAITAATVPGVSAPNPAGLSGAMVLRWARQAGRSPLVAGVDLVEICPPFDRDGQSARWAALVVWHFLVGLAERKQS